MHHLIQEASIFVCGSARFPILPKRALDNVCVAAENPELHVALAAPLENSLCPLLPF